MNATLRPTRSSLIPLAVLVVATAVSIAVVIGRHNVAGGPSIAQETVETAAVTVAPQPVATLAESVAVLEPDPEAFDRRDVDLWWSKYQHTHP